jgi:hypothetical protein
MVKSFLGTGDCDLFNIQQKMAKSKSWGNYFENC